MILLFVFLAACSGKAPAATMTPPPSTPDSTATPSATATATPIVETPTPTATETITPTPTATETVFATDEDCQNFPENPWHSNGLFEGGKLPILLSILDEFDNQLKNKFPEYWDTIVDPNAGSYERLDTDPVRDGWITEAFVYPIPLSVKPFTNRWCLGKDGTWLPLEPFLGTYDEWMTDHEPFTQRP